MDNNRQVALRQAEYFRQSRERLENEIRNLQKNFPYLTDDRDRAANNSQLDERRKELDDLARSEHESIVSKDWGNSDSLETYRVLLTNIPALWQTSTDVVRNRFLRLILNAVQIHHCHDYFDATIVWFNDQEDRIRVYIPLRSRDKLSWTAEDRAFLTEHFGTASWEELTTRLRRSQRSIFTYARHRMGIGPTVRPRTPRQQTAWTSEEENILQHYANRGMAFEDMMEALTYRGEESILSKFRNMKRKHPRQLYWYYLPHTSDDKNREITATRARTICSCTSRGS